MKRFEEESSDPLPYTQLDRAVKATAGRLAAKLKITSQHALGGLAEFWELCGDPRDLERLLDQGVREVVFPRAEVMRHFALGMGVDCSLLQAEDLVAFRLLEPRPNDSFRVRGMSRYFKVLEARRHKRAAGAAGGKKSAQVRAEKYGSAQPRPTPPRSEAASSAASAAASGDAQQPTLFPEAEPEAAPKQRRTQRTADSVQDRSDRSRPNANEVWTDLKETFEHHDVPVPEIHPADRNGRIHSLLRQLPKPDGRLLDQVLFVALEQHESLRSADNPLAYLQTMLKDPATKEGLLAAVNERTRPAA
jgi:hypothetical protein